MLCFAFVVVQFDLEILVLFPLRNVRVQAGNPTFLDSVDFTVEVKSDIVVFERNLDSGWLGFTGGFALIFWRRVRSRKHSSLERTFLHLLFVQEGYLNLCDCSLRCRIWIWLFERADTRMTVLHWLTKEINPSFCFSSCNS